MEPEEESLKFDTHYSTFYQGISSLRDTGTYSDVTLVCNGKFYPLHKLVLAICSEYFSEILEKTKDKNPMIILTGIQCSDLELLLTYMYIGEVNVRRDEIASLMKAAQILRVKDLAIQNEESNTFSHAIQNEESNTFTGFSHAIQNEETNTFSHSVLEIQHSIFENMEITNHDECKVAEASGMETYTTPSPIDPIDGKIITESISGTVAEIQNPPLKRRHAINDESTSNSSIITSNNILPFDDKLEIIRGRKKNSKSAICGGYRYCKMNNRPVGGHQGWYCANRRCKSIIYTHGKKLFTVKRGHCHEPNPKLLTPKHSPEKSLQNTYIFIKQEQEDKASVHENHFANMEITNDESTVAGTSRKETYTTPTPLAPIDDRRITENISGTVAEVQSPPLKKKKTINYKPTSNSPNIKSNSMVSINTDDKLEIIPGRKKNSLIGIYGGYRYCRMKSTLGMHQGWYCANRSCKAIIYTVGGKLFTVKKSHCHGPDPALLLPSLSPEKSLPLPKYSDIFPEKQCGSGEDADSAC